MALLLKLCSITHYKIPSFAPAYVGGFSSNNTPLLRNRHSGVPISLKSLMRSRDVFKFWEISDSISETEQDRDIVIMKDY